MKKEMSNLKNIIKLSPDNKFLYYSLDKNGEIIENTDKFKAESVLVKFSEKIKKVKEVSLYGVYITALEDEYSSIIDMDRVVEIIIDLPNNTISKNSKVLAVDFIKKEGDLYYFYLSLDSGLIKNIIEENLDSIINLKKIEILRLAELDEL